MRTLTIAATLAAALAIGVQRADASTILGTSDVSATPDGFLCAGCPAGTDMGVKQFALRGASLEVPEDGVLVSASVQARRIAGTEAPRIAVLRPLEDGVSAGVVASAPLPLTGPVSRVEGLHLPMQRGDSVGILFRTGEVDIATRARPRPDGAVQTFTVPCDPCGMDAGTGVELLLSAVTEPDVDADGLGDESQDPDGGGLGLDWEDQWFDDFAEGDELDEDFTEDFGEDERRGARRRGAPKQLRLVDADRLRGGRATLLLGVPRAGRLSASVTLPANLRTGAGPFTTILTGDMRVKRPGRVRLRLDATTPGVRALARRKRLRTKVVVAYFPQRTTLKLLMRSARL